jgi:hypothetical protein
MRFSESIAALVGASQFPEVEGIETEVLPETGSDQ